MKKRLVRAVLVGGLLAQLAGPAPAVAGPSSAGVGDPLTLAAFGVLIPYVTGGHTVALLEVASPVRGNPSLHLVFYDATCARGGSVGLPQTPNDIAFVDVGSVVPAGQNGLVAITAGGGPLTSPIHSRVYLFNTADGGSRVLEPIILDTAESPGGANTWSPLRTAATFFAPLQTAAVNTTLTLICPIATIQDASGTGAPQAFPTAQGFPAIAPAFPAAPTAGNLLLNVYDTNENFLRDRSINCGCLTELSVADISSVYGDPQSASQGTYTEILSESAFTGYREVFTVGSFMNRFFGRLNGGSQLSIGGALTIGVR